MKIALITRSARARVCTGTGARAAFTLIEVLVGVCVVGVLFISLYGGFTFGFATIELNSEELRATQILQEKMEIVRLFNWNEVTNSGFIPASFTETFASTNNGSTNTGLSYNGTVTLTNAPVSETYSNDLRMITIQLNWTSANNVAHARSMTTFISRYGLQNYIY
jgi:prepilin-type N-terminal cleavage/methylation domain-containing protein